MAISKALILQGILGVAGLCASSAGGVGLALGKTFGGGQKDQDSEDDSSLEPKAAEIIEVVKEEEDELGIPRECDTTCVLTAVQLKKLKFEVKDNEEIKFEGLNDSDEFELKIEESEDLINYPKGKKYTLKPKTIGGTVTIKNIKEENIVLENSKEVLIRETIGGGKLEHLLEEVDGLGIPKRCKADEVTGETKTCELTQRLQLEKIKFEVREGEKITVEGLNEGNKVTLTIEDKGDDEDNYPKGKKYKLTSTGYVLMEGVKGGNILLEKDKEFVIREKKGGGGLEEVLDEVDRLGIPKRCEADKVSSGTKTCPLIQKQLKDLRFEAKEGTSITVEGWNDNSKFELVIEDKKDDTENYPKGKKYTLKPKTGTATIRGIKEGDITIWDDQSDASRKAREGGKLWEGQWVVIREKEEGGKFEKAPEEVDELGIPKRCALGKRCTLTKEQLEKFKFDPKDDEKITVDGLGEGNIVTLKIEDKSGDTDNYPNGKKYIFSSKRTATIKGLKEGEIEIGRGGVVIRKKKGDIKKLEKAPKYELDKLGIPRRCKADEATVASSQTCELTREELEKLKFETESGSSISIEGLDGSDEKVELEIVMVNDDKDNYHKGKNKKYTLKALKDGVKITGAKGGEIVLEQNKGVDFRETNEGNKLETYLDVLGLPRGCKAGEVKSGSSPQTCELTHDHLKNLKFKVFEEKTGEATVNGLKGTDKIKLTISWSEDKNNYPENKKYSFDNTSRNDEIKITKGSQEITIAKKAETRFKTEEGQLALVDTKSETEIKKENKLAEVKEILKKLGFEELSTSISFTGDTNNPTRHQQTKVAEFSGGKEGGLKKIQFKALGGGAENTDPSSLGFSEIKVFLDWEEDTSKYPYNMKFSFLNQNFMSFDFKKGNSSVKIAQKKSGTSMPTFKVEKNQDNWYLVKS